MRRTVITVAISLIVLVLVGGGVLAYGFFCSGPSVTVTGDANKKEFVAHFLGEYCDSFSRVTVTDTVSNAVVWDVEISPTVAFCDFSLSPGKNSAFQERVSRVIVPSDQAAFTLTKGTKYKVTVRRQGSTARCRVSSQTFEF
jgi:hypothetical protein